MSRRFGCLGDPMNMSPAVSFSTPRAGIFAAPLARSRISVRALAASLGLAKDTVGRALRRLRALGLVTPPDQRRERTGTVGAGTYLIGPPIGITLANAAPMQTTPHVRPGRTRPADASQLAHAIDS